MKNLAALVLIAVIFVVSIGLTGCSGHGTTTASSLTPSLASVSVGATSSSLSVGQTLKMSAIGYYSDKSSQILTSASVWQTSDATVATVDGSGTLSALKPGIVTVTATVGSTAGSLKIAVKAPTLSSILIVPVSNALVPGQTRQLVATGVYSDGSSQDLTSQVSWSSSNQLIATVNASGLLTAIAAGQATITATSGSASGTASVNVSSVVLASIIVTPANVSLATGQTHQFAANGVFSDGSTTDITNSVVWETDAHAVATISQAGLAIGVGPGTANITATSAAVVGTIPIGVTSAVLQSIDISPNDQSIPAGSQVQFSATGTFSDSTTQDLANATFSSSDTKTAVVDPATGSATGVAANSTPVTITATAGGFTDTTTLTVTSAALQSISIDPPSATIAKGTTQQFSVSGIYSDGSTMALTEGLTWTTSSSAITVVDGSGMASAIGVGAPATINVTYAGLSTSATLTVTQATLTSLTVTPALSTVGVGGTQQFTATGVFSDGSTQDVTSMARWTSSSASIALISSDGWANTVGKGNAQITAQYQTASGSAALTVSIPVLTSIMVMPPNPVVPTYSRIQFTAVGVFSDGTTIPLSRVYWHTSWGRVARISYSGLVRTRQAGTATVTAWLHGMTGSTTMTVTSSSLTSVTISPDQTTIAPGTTQQFSLIGTFGDGAQVDLTKSAYWQTSNWKNAIITNTGLARGFAAGQVTITAFYRSLLSDQTTLTVSDASLVSIAVSPSAPTVVLGGTEPFTATGTFSDGSTQDITSICRWTSSNPVVAIVTRGGLAFSAAHGSANISATYKTITGATVLNVN